jgi:hypothetical protein
MPNKSSGDFDSHSRKVVDLITVFSPQLRLSLVRAVSQRSLGAITVVAQTLIAILGKAGFPDFPQYFHSIHRRTLYVAVVENMVDSKEGILCFAAAGALASIRFNDFTAKLLAAFLYGLLQPTPSFGVFQNRVVQFFPALFAVALHTMSFVSREIFLTIFHLLALRTVFFHDCLQFIIYGFYQIISGA